MKVMSKKNPEVSFPLADLTTAITDYEMGQLDHEDVVTLFQRLIDTGIAWQLQGHYGRTAVDLIRAGECQAS